MRSQPTKSNQAFSLRKINGLQNVAEVLLVHLCHLIMQSMKKVCPEGQDLKKLIFLYYFSKDIPKLELSLCFLQVCVSEEYNDY